MLTPNRTRRSLLVSLIAGACVAIPSIPFANHSWNGYHWARASNPFTVNLGDNVSAGWDSYLATTSSDWTASVVLNTPVVPGGARPRNCRPTAGRVEVCNSTYGNTGWLGVAQVWVSGSHITQGTVKINDTYFNTAQYDTPGWRNLVMCQEVGHTLGLDHQDTTFTNPNLGTCMDYTNNPYGPPDNEHPNQHDYDELITIYSHLDGAGGAQTTAETPMPPAMTQIDLAGPAQWGRIVRSNHNGKMALYEADFGGGHKVFTFVIWA